MKVLNFVYRRRKLFSCLSLVLIISSCIVPSCFASETTDSVDKVLDVMGRFSEKALGSQGVGSQVITFITSNPLCLIGVACFIMVALVGLVRRFIIGS